MIKSVLKLQYSKKSMITNKFRKQQAFSQPLSLKDAFGYIKINNKPQEIQSQNFDKQIKITKEEHAKETMMKLGEN